MTSTRAPKTVAALRKISALGLRPITLPDGTEHQLTDAEWLRFLRSRGRTKSGCWVWAGSRLPTGYGKFNIKRHSMYTHRIAYMIFVGDIPAGLHIDHLCRNRACYNPAHLEPVTCRENVLRSPIHMAAINAQKTECVRGHPLSGENLMLAPDGGRKCRACGRAACNKRYANLTTSTVRIGGKRKWPGSIDNGTKCRNGHKLTDDNIYSFPSGQRRCRKCQDDSADRRRGKAQASTAGQDDGATDGR